MPSPTRPAPDGPAPATPAPAPPQPDTQPDTTRPARPDRDTTTVPRTEDGDHDRFAHYVPKDKLNRALVEGEPVRALCGKIWVPSRDPERYPVCPTCEELLAAVRGGDGSADGGSGDDA